MDLLVRGHQVLFDGGQPFDRARQNMEFVADGVDVLVHLSAVVAEHDGLEQAVVLIAV
jgi:hypothetical protein